MIENESEKYKGYRITYMKASVGTTWTEIYYEGNHLSTYVSKNKTEAQKKAYLWINRRAGYISTKEYDRKIGKFLK
jgi:hypothetical protein